MLAGRTTTAALPTSEPRQSRHERLLALVVQDQAPCRPRWRARPRGRRASPARSEWWEWRYRASVFVLLLRLEILAVRGACAVIQPRPRRRRSLIARPNPVSGMGMTAMRPMPGRSSARSMANRLAAASARSPARAEIVGQPGRLPAPWAEGEQAFVGGDGGRVQPHRPRRRIVACELARRFAGRVARRNGIAQRHWDRSPPRSPRAWRRRAAAASASRS